MRARKKKHVKERIEACSSLMTEGHDVADSFPAARPICLEIGCGKGAFVCNAAKKYPSCNFVAMERVPDIACAALEKAAASASERTEDNIRFLIAEAENIEDFFPPRSVDAICLNFSDPWPKTKHMKRRLTHAAFLEKYEKTLKPGGRLYFKTDDKGLFDFTLSQFGLFDAEILYATEDLHSSKYDAENIRTEYEENFTAAGKPIYACCAEFHTGSNGIGGMK